jgi:serine/threonine-protein kinase
LSGEPKTIGRYQLIAPLGEGGMARVFLAVSRGPGGFNKLVVVKLVKRELLSDPDFVTMFLDEARLAARLNHPNVVQTYEVGEEEGHYFLTMEFLDGQPLSEVLSRVGRQKMPLHEHLWILTRVLEGLHYAHEVVDFDGTRLDVVHRDVSPANVFVTYAGAVKLVDFGVAKAAGALAVTQKGMFKGKFGYGAPEQMLEKPIDRRADLFSVGIMLWEALAGKSFAAGRGLEPLVSARVSGRDPRIREVRPDVDDRLAAICDRAMALEPADRFPTAAAFRDELERYLDGCPARVTARDVSQLVSRSFEVDRAEMRQSIEVSVRRPRPGLLTGTSPGEGAADGADYASLSVTAWPEGAIVTPDDWGSEELESSAAGAVTEPSPGVPSGKPSSEVSTIELISAREPVPTPNTVGGLTLGGVESASPHASRETTQPSAGAPMSRRGRIRALPLMVVTVTGAVIGAAIVLVSAGGLEAPGNEDPPEGASAPLAAPSALRARSSAEPRSTVESGETVNLYISTIPSDAVVTLDGRQLATNPFSAAVPRERKTHVVRAEAPGFLPEERVVAYSHDLHVEIELRPLVGSVPVPTGTAQPRPTGTVPMRPGSDLRPPVPTAKPSRTIDERDPWSR